MSQAARNADASMRATAFSHLIGACAKSIRAQHKMYAGGEILKTVYFQNVECIGLTKKQRKAEKFSRLRVLAAEFAAARHARMQGQWRLA